MFGLPFDCVYLSRMGYWFYDTFSRIPEFLARRVLNANFDHDLYGLEPKHPPFRQHPFINDALPSRILAGRICVKSGIAGFEKRRIIFEDQSTVDDTDDVILCTGFSIGFPYLEDGALYLDDNKVHLYKNMYPPAHAHPTLGVIGLIQPHGAILPVSEMQSRVFTHVLAGDVKLPHRESMEADIAKIDQYNLNRFYHSRRHTIQVDYIPFCDKLADLLGAQIPSFFRFLVSDPQLALASYAGSGAPYQYRLFGPHRWAPARQHMLTVWDRVRYALRPDAARNSQYPNGSWLVYRQGLYVALIVVVFICVLLWIPLQMFSWLVSH